MHFSVRHGLQNAPFRRVRFFLPGQTRRHLTQRRILAQPPYAKAHSGGSEDPKVRLTVRVSYRVRFSVRHGMQTAPFRDVATPGRCGATPPPGCGALWKLAQLDKCARETARQAAGRVASGPADLGLESDLTERRTLANLRAADCAFP